MSKKDYILIAQTIKEVGGIATMDANSFHVLVSHFADVLEKNHPEGGYSFDRDAFVKACQ